MIGQPYPYFFYGKQSSCSLNRKGIASPKRRGSQRLEIVWFKISKMGVLIYSIKIEYLSRIHVQTVKNSNKLKNLTKYAIFRIMELVEIHLKRCIMGKKLISLEYFPNFRNQDDFHER